MPDITACVAGRRVEIEVKRPGKDATPLQERKLEKWSRAEAVVGVARSVNDVKTLFEASGIIR